MTFWKRQHCEDNKDPVLAGLGVEGVREGRDEQARHRISRTMKTTLMVMMNKAASWVWPNPEGT